MTFEDETETSFINALYHTRALHCHAEFDSVSGLTVNPIDTLSSKRKKGWLASCNRIRRPIIDMLGYLTYVLIIAILPTNPANDLWYDFDIRNPDP